MEIGFGYAMLEEGTIGGWMRPSSALRLRWLARLAGLLDVWSCWQIREAKAQESPDNAEIAVNKTEAANEPSKGEEVTDPPQPPVLVAPNWLHQAELDLQNIDRPEQFCESTWLLKIDADGLLLEKNLQDSCGDLADEAASRLLEASLFSPATRDGIPMSARFKVAVQIPAKENIEEIEPKSAEADSITTSAVVAEVSPSSQPIPSESSIAPADNIPSSADGKITTLDPSTAQNSDNKVYVRGTSVQRQREHSAEAVHVIDFDKDSLKTDNVAQALNRSGSITVRRMGGFGSRTELSMGGYGGDRLRLFVDGLPIDIGGFPLGVDSLSVQNFSRADMYLGVVPIRLGSDALGGAIDFVSDRSLDKNRIWASFLGGSYETYQLKTGTRQRWPESGIWFELDVQGTSAKNNYTITAPVVDSDGNIETQEVERFHDAYKDLFLRTSIGVIGKSWAKQARLSLHAAGFDKEIQSDAGMQRAYGEVNLSRAFFGGNTHHEWEISKRFELHQKLAYQYTRSHFMDVSGCRYNFAGQCLVDLAPRGIRGEINQIPRDVYIDDNALTTRHELRYAASKYQHFSMQLAPRWDSRSGENREAGDLYDPLKQPQHLFTFVGGLEWKAQTTDEELENIAFVKLYGQYLKAEQETGIGIESIEQGSALPGLGDAIRYSISKYLDSKFAYEWAARLPEALEWLGDGALIVRNLELSPERSHNFHLELIAHDLKFLSGIWELKGTGQARFAENWIVLLSSGQYLQYDNVLSAQSLVMLGSIDYRVDGDWLRLRSNFQYDDTRNNSNEGPMALFLGSRLPNRPYFQSHHVANLRLHHMIQQGDLFVLSYLFDYVEGFLRGWEGIGDPNQRLEIPSQAIHSIALSYEGEGFGTEFTSTLELRNLTDSTAFDFYGIQRPGRSIFLNIKLGWNQNDPSQASH